MNTVEIEKQKIQKRIDEIKNTKPEPGTFKTIVIAAGDPVISDFSDEYVALNNMLKIFDGNFDKEKYIELRAKTKLEPLNEQDLNDLLGALNFSSEEEPTLKTIAKEDFYQDGKFLDFYGMLGLDQSATIDEIEDAYKKISTRYAITPSDPPQFKAAKEQFLSTLEIAHLALTTERKLYDETLTSIIAPDPIEQTKDARKEFVDELGNLIDAYGELGIKEDATEEEIDRAHEIIANFYRKAHARGEGTDEMLAKNLARLDRAHRILSERRAAYDEVVRKTKEHSEQPDHSEKPDEKPPISFVDKNGKFIDVYEVLGIERTATEQEIDAAYNSAIQFIYTAHPGIMSPEKREEGIERIEQSYQILKENRVAYNEQYVEYLRNRQNPNPSKGDESEKGEDLGDLIEIEKVSPWKRIGKHKKAILIAVGITAITVSVVVAMTAIAGMAPAVLAAEKATQVSGLVNSMMANSQAWAGASAAEQLALQGANLSAAEQITSLTGLANNMGAGGVWKFGGEAISSFAKTAAANVTSTAGVLSKLQSITSLSKLGILGGGLSLGTGLIIPKTKTRGYYEIKALIEEFKENSVDMTREENIQTIQALNEKILTSTMIEPREKDKLLKKLQKAARKVNSMMDLREGENLDVEDTHEYIIGGKEAPEQDSPVVDEDADMRIKY